MRTLKKVVIATLTCLGTAIVAWIAWGLLLSILLIGIRGLYWTFYESSVGLYVVYGSGAIVAMGSVVWVLVKLLTPDRK